MDKSKQTGMCLETALDYLNWQGGTFHQVKSELVSHLNKVYDVNYSDYGKRVDLAIEMLREAGVSGLHTAGRALTLELLKASMYGEEMKTTGTVSSLVGRVR